MTMPTATKAKPRARKRVSHNRNQAQFWSYVKDWTKFRGEYIAFEGDRIVAHGSDAGVVLKQARLLAADPILQLVPRAPML